jgi:Ca2+-binding EF-hand superfamily protein
MFNKMDTDGSGSLSFGELKKGLTAQTPGFISDTKFRELRMIYEQTDKDGDGKITYEGK